jgi:NAD(P)-dependent dehydrogenase (short-subunit alcohol dehydrogenase family)
VQGTGVVPLSFAPGIMDTQMQSAIRVNPLPEAELFRQYHARGWLRPPVEAAACIAWLCGPEGALFAGAFVDVHSTALRAQVGLPDLPEALRRP